MLEKFKGFLLTGDQLKHVKGGISTWECSCQGGAVGFNGYGSNGDFRQDVIDAGCSNSPTYCWFNEV
jgi:hypothetical protein